MLDKTYVVYSTKEVHSRMDFFDSTELCNSILTLYKLSRQTRKAP